MIATKTLDRTEIETKRDALRADLEATRKKFHELVESVSDKQWRSKSPTTEWSVAEIFYHLTWALEQLPREVESARKGKGMFNMPKWIANPGSYWITRFSARNATHKSIHSRYDAAMDAVIEALDRVPDSDWGLGAEFYGEGFHSVEDLFRTPGEHLRDHTVGM
jgi:hypothetical protein